MSNSNSTHAFVANPYVANGFLRDDVFSTQFSIYIELEIGRLDNDRVSIYSVNTDRFIGGTSTVIDAVELISKFINQHNGNNNALHAMAWEHIDEEDCLEYVSVMNVRIYDREHRLIMGGTVRGTKIDWAKTVTSSSERAGIKAQIKALESEARLEAGWDNFSTAGSLRESAARLHWKLSTSPIVETKYFQQELAQVIV